MTFIDTNVLIYAVDARDARKQQAAKAIVMGARNSSDYVISSQVLNEFSNVAINKLGKTRLETRAFVQLFMDIGSIAVCPEWTIQALDIMERYGIQFFDSLLLAAAESVGCDEILTEDLGDGQIYCGIKAVNPFKGM